MTETNTPIKTRELFNPTAEDITFKYDNAPYAVQAGGRVTLLQHIAEHGAKKLADKYRKTNNPNEHKVLVAAFLQEVSPEDVAKQLGIDLGKIISKASTKEKEKADLINVKDLIKRQSAELAELRGEVKELKVKKESPKVEKPEVKPVVKNKTIK